MKVMELLITDRAMIDAIDMDVENLQMIAKDVIQYLHNTTWCLNEDLVKVFNGGKRNREDLNYSSHD